MNFKSNLNIGVKKETSTLRVRSLYDREIPARKKRSKLIFSNNISKLTQHITHWRVSFTTGQLERRCSLSDSEDPQSRPSFG